MEEYIKDLNKKILVLEEYVDYLESLISYLDTFSDVKKLHLDFYIKHISDD